MTLNDKEREYLARVHNLMLFDIALKVIASYGDGAENAGNLWHDAFVAAWRIDHSETSKDHVALAATRLERVKEARKAWIDRAFLDPDYDADELFPDEQEEA